MNKIIGSAIFALSAAALHGESLRAPSYPLVTHDPYLSIWSPANNLNDVPTQHWTGANHPIYAFVKVDGVSYQIMSKMPSKLVDVVKTGNKIARDVKYTYTKPDADWMTPGFNDSAWKTGRAPFGDGGDTSRFNTPYDDKIWYRYDFELETLNFEDLQLFMAHDDDVEVYINGVAAFIQGGANNYRTFPISAEALAALKLGKNTIAIHCVDTGGDAYVDVGLVDEQAIGDRIPKATQTDVQLSATQTVYSFKAGGVDVGVTFTSPLLMNDLDIISRPASYVTFDVKSSDATAHEVDIYFGFSGLLATNGPDDRVTKTKEKEVIPMHSHPSAYEATKAENTLLIQSVGTKSQKILNRSGDDLRIDWGYALLGARGKNVTAVEGNLSGLLKSLNGGSIDPVNENDLRAKDALLAVKVELGKVKEKKTGHVVVAYNDEYSIQYFGKNLRPWWNREGKITSNQLVMMAENDYERLMKECTVFDKQMRADAIKAGGEKYAQLCELAYRQSIAAHKIVASPSGELFFFSKENNSNGSIGTVDITYPSAPLYILYNTELMKGMLRFIFEYSESGRWEKPFVAHDVGTYPLANGQTYDGDMPVEESGNMIIIMAATAKEDGDLEFVKKHWNTLTIWTNYLKEHGLDPANQLCTDDFAGHFARNVNLSAKAIMGIVSYAQLAKMIGKDDVAEEYMAVAKDYVQKWMKMADEGDHYGLVFETKNTWSQKYNIVWDKMFKTNVFPQSVINKELAYYKTKQQVYGLPLDNRQLYSKADWITWTATLADNQKDFHFFTDPIWKYANETTSRVPFCDWYWTQNGNMRGFKARSVVGGLFIKMLDEKWNGK